MYLQRLSTYIIRTSNNIIRPLCGGKYCNNFRDRLRKKIIKAQYLKLPSIVSVAGASPLVRGDEWSRNFHCSNRLPGRFTLLLYCVRNIIYYNNINSVKFYLFVHKTDTHNAVSVAAAHQVVRHCFVTMRVYVHLYTRVYILIVVRNIGRFENWGEKSQLSHTLSYDDHTTAAVASVPHGT